MAAKETTFNSFTPDQAAAYASNRGMSYPQPIYDAVLRYHADRPRHTLLDVGTGPGKVVFDLLPSFTLGLGCDSSPGMIEQANKDAVRRDVSATTKFAVCGGEECADAFPHDQADVMTVAMAAHWFDMPSFYASAAKALKPGGTLAIWTCSSTFVHPSVPNHAELQKILFDLEHGTLGPYTVPGNAVSRDAYDSLPLPWDDAQTTQLFDKTTFERIDWDRHGVPSAPPLADGTPGPFLFDRETPIAVFATILGSASMVIRWREAHPELANTDRDAVNVTARRLKEANGGRDSFRMCPSSTMLLFRRC